MVIVLHTNIISGVSTENILNIKMILSVEGILTFTLLDQ